MHSIRSTHLFLHWFLNPKTNLKRYDIHFIALCISLPLPVIYTYVSWSHIPTLEFPSLWSKTLFYVSRKHV